MRRKEQLEEQKRIKRREYRMVGSFRLLWAVMLALTVLAVVHLERLGIWLAIEDRWVLLAVACGILVLICTMLAVVLFRKFRKKN